MSINDDVVSVLDRVYVKATVTVWNDKEVKTGVSLCKGSRNKKRHGRITNNRGSFKLCRKYALNGMFLIDDTKDADSQDNSKHAQPQGITEKHAQKKPEIDKASVMGEIITLLKTSGLSDDAMAQLRNEYQSIKTVGQANDFKARVEKLLMVQKKFVDDPIDARELI